MIIVLSIIILLLIICVAYLLYVVNVFKKELKQVRQTNHYMRHLLWNKGALH